MKRFSTIIAKVLLFVFVAYSIHTIYLNFKIQKIAYDLNGNGIDEVLLVKRIDYINFEHKVEKMNFDDFCEDKPVIVGQDSFFSLSNHLHKFIVFPFFSFSEMTPSVAIKFSNHESNTYYDFKTSGSGMYGEVDGHTFFSFSGESFYDDLISMKPKLLNNDQTLCVHYRFK